MCEVLPKTITATLSYDYQQITIASTFIVTDHMIPLHHIVTSYIN